MIRRLLPVLLVAVLTPAWAASPPAPRLELGDGGRVTVSDLPAILDDEEVKPHLTKGLTVTFLLRLEVPGSRRRGGARIEVRYELWDEVFEVTAMSSSGIACRTTLASPEELADWWAKLRLDLGSGLSPPSARAARLVLEMVPFSQAEERDAQRWFSESLEKAGAGGAEEITSAAGEGAETLDRTFHLLMATSIQRRALVSYRWTLALKTPP